MSLGLWMMGSGSEGSELMSKCLQLTDKKQLVQVMKECEVECSGGRGGSDHGHSRDPVLPGSEPHLIRAYRTDDDRRPFHMHLLIAPGGGGRDYSTEE